MLRLMKGLGGSIPAKRVWLTRKSRPGLPVHSRPDPRLQTPKRWKRLQPPGPSGFGGEARESANLSPRLGVVRVRRLGRLEPAPGGNRRRVSSWSAACTGPVFFFNSRHACTCLGQTTHVNVTSAPQPPPPQQPPQGTCSTTRHACVSLLVTLLVSRLCPQVLCRFSCCL